MVSRNLFLAAGSMLLLFCSVWQPTAFAQETVSSASLPDATQSSQTAAPSSAPDSQQSTGSLSGTVMDANGDVLQGAVVALEGQSGSAARAVKSGKDGQFAFTGLSPDVYKVTVTAAGMSSFTSPQIALHAGEFHIVPPIKLSVSPVSTSVTVSGGKEAEAEEQLRIAEQQRIGGSFQIFTAHTTGMRRQCKRSKNFSLAFVL